jgi:6-hydroxycyclohex-1-ene-1-carbonyl-CoA dehydrogenase
MRIRGWQFTSPGEPLEPHEREALPGPGEVLIEVAGCGLCHTDLGFFHGDVPTRHSLPLVLGHEISGKVLEAGEGCEDWPGRAVIVPAVIPCQSCPACSSGRPSICSEQVFPGNDVHGGFASHVVVPARGLCAVPDSATNSPDGTPLDLIGLSVIADAVSTPFEAIRRSGLTEGDLAVFVGVGGVGGFGVQIAAARNASVAAIDVDPGKLELLSERGADLTMNAAVLQFKQIRKALREFAADRQIPTWRWKIFETSGSPQGQATAFGLLGQGSYLGVVGYTPAKTELRLSNLMALDATARGNWGCPPEHYPAVLDLVLSGKVKLAPFVEKRPLSSINEAFEEAHSGALSRRIILVPEH